MTNRRVFEHDLNVQLKPCTQMKGHAFLSMILIKSAKGVWPKGFAVILETAYVAIRDL